MANLEIFQNLDASNVTEVAFSSAIAHSTGSFTWLAGNGLTQITALSGIENIVANGAGIATAGTINGLSAFNTVLTYTVTGLNTPVTQLFDAVGFNPVVSHELYWESILAGATGFQIASTANANLTGDFILVNNGQTVIGAADRFDVSLSKEPFENSPMPLFLPFQTTLAG